LAKREEKKLSRTNVRNARRAGGGGLANLVKSAAGVVSGF